MANHIRAVRIVNHRLDPHETELRIHVELAEVTPKTQIKGRLMGPRNVYASTVEVAYPMREVERGTKIVMRVVIPEPSWWEPKTPFLYEGPLELWQDGQICARSRICHRICNLQNGEDGWRLNGQPFVPRGKAVELPFDETRARQWHDDGINSLRTGVDTPQSETALWALADRFGFLMMDEDGVTLQARPQPE
jgi:beta-galactosidase/beta-glucuronidase